jgi:hypothetical protein
MAWNDAGPAAHDTAVTKASLADAQAEAAAIAARFTAERTENPLRPDVTVDLDVGGDDQPLFVFSVNVDLDDDLAASEYPLDELQELASALRSQVAESPVNGWASLVTVGTRAGAAHR